MSGSTKAMTPREAADEALTYFRSDANPEKAEKLQRYFKDPVDSYGVDYGPFKEWKADFHERLKAHWTIREAVEFCELMLEDKYMESRGTGYQAVGVFVDEAGPDLLIKIKEWLEGFCGNWGLVDNLAPYVLSPLLKKHPELVEEVKGWTQSPNQWVRRGAAVGFVSLVGEPEFQDAAYEIAKSLQEDKEDLIHKAVGWLLREAGKVDRERLETYLLDQGPRTPRTTLRYAIEKFPKEDRKRIMAATR
jgi:3-methyladenine DNA glycosylase AlkD